MFGDKQKQIDELEDRLTKLWGLYTSLALSVKQLTEIIQQMANAGLENRKDFEFLAEQTMRIADQQNKLVAHVMRSDDALAEKFQSTSLH